MNHLFFKRSRASDIHLLFCCLSPSPFCLGLRDRCRAFRIKGQPDGFSEPPNRRGEESGHSIPLHLGVSSWGPASKLHKKQKGRQQDCLPTTTGNIPQIPGFLVSCGPSISPGCIHLQRFLTTDFPNLQQGLPELFQTLECFQTPITGWLWNRA